MTTKKHYTTKDLAREFGALTFGSALEAHRMSEDLSQKAFAKTLGISAQSLCDLEKGRRVPSVDRAAKIANRLKEPIETWVELVLQDQLREARLSLHVEVKKVS
jgi:transcriptional regulator with XRE-family HTH domain